MLGAGGGGRRGWSRPMAGEAQGRRRGVGDTEAVAASPCATVGTSVATGWRRVGKSSTGRKRMSRKPASQ